MKGPHICDCLCALCERLGAGAFGPQPDGSAGVVVINRRRARRRRPPNRAQVVSQRQLGRVAGVRCLAKADGTLAVAQLAKFRRDSLQDPAGALQPSAGPWEVSR